MKFFAALTIALWLSVALSAQTGEITYQGRLLDNNLPPTASYDLRFELFDVADGGTALAIVTRTSVPVVGGVFRTVLNFGSSFTGADRWIQVSVRPASTTDPYIELAGRQRITSTPYAIRYWTISKAAVFSIGFVPSRSVGKEAIYSTSDW